MTAAIKFGKLVVCSSAPSFWAHPLCSDEKDSADEKRYAHKNQSKRRYHRSI